MLLLHTKNICHELKSMFMHVQVMHKLWSIKYIKHKTSALHFGMLEESNWDMCLLWRWTMSTNECPIISINPYHDDWPHIYNFKFIFYSTQCPWSWPRTQAIVQQITWIVARKNNSTTLVKVKILRAEHIEPLALKLRIQGGIDHWKNKVTRHP
jgi:hypothetical protein